jgi:hypothetical protein
MITVIEEDGSEQPVTLISEALNVDGVGPSAYDLAVSNGFQGSLQNWLLSLKGEPGGSGSGDVVGPASSTDSQLVLFNDATGKAIKAATVSGMLKAASGVLSEAEAGTDYSTASSTETLTNKTFDANGAGNTLSNVELADFASGVVNQSASLSDATNSQVPTAAAVKAYVDASFGANDAMVFKGAIDASSNPNYPSGDTGDTWKFSVAGRIGGADGSLVMVGDTMYCTLDDSAAGDHATVGANWVIVQANVGATAKADAAQAAAISTAADDATAKADAAQAAAISAAATDATTKADAALAAALLADAALEADLADKETPAGAQAKADAAQAAAIAAAATDATTKADAALAAALLADAESTRAVEIGTSRDITAADHNSVLRCTAAITLTWPDTLTPQPTVIVIAPPSGSATLAVSGTATLNGAGTSLTRGRATNPAGVAIVPYGGAAYGVSGS